MNTYGAFQTSMANWRIYAANHWLKPIYELLKTELILNDILCQWASRCIQEQQTQVSEEAVHIGLGVAAGEIK